MRKVLIAGNWKMNHTIAVSQKLVKALAAAAKEMDDREYMIAPVFTALPAVSEQLQGTCIHVGAQNMHWEESGAYTGEISPAMLGELHVSYVILGHSERRQYFGETDEMVQKKTAAALRFGIAPIICCGETWEQREEGKTQVVITDQIEKAVAEVGGEEAHKIVIAYEPIWAIGTGKSASPEDAQVVCMHIRQVLTQRFGSEVAQKIRILYGGSVKGSNCREYMNQPDIDGALVGGASLKAADFLEIMEFTR